MKVVDANVLLHAVNRDSEQHAAARRWLDDALQGDETIGFAWTVLLAFLRVSTHPAVFAKPLTSGQALATVEAWLAQAPAVTIEPGMRHLAILGGLIGGSGTAGNLVNDGHLAALAVEYGAELVSFDADFNRFPGLRWAWPGVEGWVPDARRQLGLGSPPERHRGPGSMHGRRVG